MSNPNNNNSFNPNKSAFGASGANAGNFGGLNSLAGGSLFGPTPALGASFSQFNPNNSINGVLNAGGFTGPAGQSAYFDHMLRRTRRQPTANGNADSLPTPEGTPFAQFQTLPDLQLGPGDIAQILRNIGGGGAPANGTGGDNTAHYLLAASGVPTTATVRDLNNLAARMGTVPASHTNDADVNIDNFVAGVSSQTTLDIIGEGLDQAKRDFDTFLQDNVRVQWDVQRRRIYEHFGLAKPSEAADDFSQSGAFGHTARQSRPFARTSTFAGTVTRSVIGNPGMGASVLGKSGFGRSRFGATGEDSKGVPASQYDIALQREKQEKYMSCVHELNVSRLRDEAYPLIHKFQQVERTGGPEDNSILNNSFSSLIKVTGESSEISPLSQPGIIRERQFASQYLSDTKGQDTEVRKKILVGSRKALEESFMAKVENMIERHPREANIGGIPSPINKIRAYIRVRLARKEFGSDDEILQFQMLNNDYLWVLIFYLLRAGLSEVAREYVASNQRAIQGIDRNFPQVITHYARDSEHNLPLSLRTALVREWETQKKYPQEQVDPYRMACYKILGRIELERRTLSNVSLTHDDWTWLQFTLARESRPTEELATTLYDLEALRQNFLDLESRHFSGGADSIDSPVTYFNLLMLSGLYEKAVGWLYDFNPITAIHFAIALDYYGLLRVSDVSQNEVLVAQTNGTWKINFGLVVGHYTADFRAAYPEIAADYLCLICLDSDLPGQLGQRQVNLCHEALRELVLETREFTLLLGDIHEDGQRVKGAIEQRIKLIKLPSHESFFRTISTQAASVAEDCGRIGDAVILYHLSGDFDSVVRIVNRTLADVVCTNIGEETVKIDPFGNKKKADLKGKKPVGTDGALSLTAVEEPADLAEKIYMLYSTNIEIQRQVSSDNWDVLVTLAQLARARNWIDMASTNDGAVNVAAGAWERALDLIRETDVLPLQAEGNISAIRHSAAQFNSFPAELARTIGPLLLFTVTACGRERERLRSSMYVDETKNRKIAALGQIAKDLMVFAGLVRYRLETRVFEALARIGGDIGM